MHDRLRVRQESALVMKRAVAAIVIRMGRLPFDLAGHIQIRLGREELLELRNGICAELAPINSRERLSAKWWHLTQVDVREDRTYLRGAQKPSTRSRHPFTSDLQPLRYSQAPC